MDLSAHVADGWTATTAQFTRRDGLAFCHVILARVGTDIANTGSTGDITNVSLMEGIPAEWRPIVPEAGLGPSSKGRLVSILIDNLGRLRLAAVGGTTNLATGTSISASGVYPINPPLGGTLG